MNNDYVLTFFNCDTLPEDLRGIGKTFLSLAEQLLKSLPDNSDRNTAIRKLIEARDCMIRAKLYGE